MLRWPWFQSGGGRTNTDRSPNKRVDNHYQTLSGDQQYNPYSEVLILTGGLGCVSSVYQIDLVGENKFITASDNGLAVVWNAENGQKLAVLDHRRGERERVSLMAVLSLYPMGDSIEHQQQRVIMTADSLGVLHVWNWNSHDPLGESPYQRVVKDHDGMIKCLVQFNQDLICSGGSDLCLWDRKGKLFTKFSRRDLEEKSSIHSVLKLDSRHFGVVAASDYKSLAVYDISKHTMAVHETDEYDLKFVRYLLSSHVLNICSLTSISANLFASGSCDGVVLLWSTSSLSAMKMFQCAEGMPKELNPAPSAPPTSAPASKCLTEIRHILVIGERYLFAAIGCGFRVYDVLTYEDTQGHPKPLASVGSAHQQPITCMVFLQDRAVLATASEDHTVRLWGRPNKLKRENDGSVSESQLSGKFLIEEFLGTELSSQRTRKKGSSPLTTPMLLGELLLHSSAVKVLMDLEDHGLVTCSTDNFIILWKDAEREREKRDRNLRSQLHGELQGETNFYIS